MAHSTVLIHDTKVGDTNDLLLLVDGTPSKCKYEVGVIDLYLADGGDGANEEDIGQRFDRMHFSGNSNKVAAIAVPPD
jgi:hypothetical protein